MSNAHRAARGSTPLFKSIEVSGKCHGATVFVKDEGKNPFGTFKDRRCAALLEMHRERPEMVLVQITYGNSGYSLGMFAQEEERRTGKRITVVNIVPKGIPKKIRAKLETCSIVYEMDLTKRVITREEIKAIARRLSSYQGSDDNILTVEDFGLANGYRRIIDEIAESGVLPKFIFCPVGEGELITELTLRALEVWSEQPPKIVGVTITQNAIVQKDEFIQKLGKSVADKLVNGYSKFRAFVIGFVRDGKAELVVVREAEIERAYRDLNTIGIGCEPSAAAAFAGAFNYQLGPEDTVVIINTGKGIYDQSAVDRVWSRRLRNSARRLGMALAGAAVALGLVTGAVFERNQAYQNWRNKLELMTLLYFDNDRNGWLSEGEAGSACSHIPGRTCETPEGGHPLVYGFNSFTDKELAFLTRYQGYAKQNDVIGREGINMIRSQWDEGTFDEFEYTDAPWILRADRTVRRALTPRKGPSNCDPLSTRYMGLGWEPGKDCPPYIR